MRQMYGAGSKAQTPSGFGVAEMQVNHHINTYEWYCATMLTYITF